MHLRSESKVVKKVNYSYTAIMPRKSTKPTSNNKTRIKIDSTPFETAAEMKAASKQLRMQVWNRLEYARLFQEMTENENYKFVQEELKNGLTCNFGEDSEDHLVKVFSEGSGIRISINKDLVRDVDKSEGFVEALIRSTSDSFSKSYYQIKGMLPIENTLSDVAESNRQKKK